MPDKFDPYLPEVRRDPYPWYRELLEHDPVHRGAHGFWYLASYADVRMVMADKRFGRDEFRARKLEMQGPGPLSVITESHLFYIDPPDHDRLHSLIRKELAPVIVRGLESDMSQLVNRMIDRAGAGHMDMIGELARPFPLRVIGDLIGMPATDLELLHEWGLALAETTDPVPDTVAIERGHRRIGEYIDYMSSLVEQRRRSPGTDLVSRLFAAGPDQITEQEIIAMIMVLVNAGHETTTNLIGNGLLALLEHPDQLRALRETPSLIKSAIEECLRYDSPVQQNARVVQVDDVELQGHIMKRGDTVVVLQGSANRDPARFPLPDDFDIARPNNQHMSFGRGMRFCVGAPLARLEGAIALSAIIGRLRDVRLAIERKNLTYAPSSLFRGVESLPVEYVKVA